MPKTYLITGATGLIGTHIAAAVTARGDEFIALSTNPDSARKKIPNAKKIVKLQDMLSLKDEKIDAVINLAGANLGGKRWNDKTKKEFYDSRIDTTRGLVELISGMMDKPGVFISASGVDYYEDSGDTDVYENAPHGDGYLARLCLDWENEALKAKKAGVRTVILRTGFVLAKGSESVDKLILPIKLFVGGPLGGGRQYVSWIHIDDLVGMYLMAVDNPELRGVYNAAAPNPERSKDFGKIAAKLLKRPYIFPVPGFMIKLLVGEMAVVVLEGRRALPKKIIDAGYEFKHTNAEDACREVLG
jgi:uncharacterized protein (TIGR01777 family)